MTVKTKNYKVTQQIGLRLDKALVDILGDVSRSHIQKLIDDGYIFVNNSAEKMSYRLQTGDVINVVERENKASNLSPEYIPLDIVYEDDDIIVINKQRGLVVHPGAGNKDLTLANALMYHTKQLSSINGEFRPGIVHRIDKDTSGLLVVAKNDLAHNFLSAQLKDHTMSRKYLALVHGVIFEDEGKIIAPLSRDKKNRLKMAVDLHDGKEAITHFRVVNRFANATLVECRLETGRTHQIRVHFEYIRHPLVGDSLYGKKSDGIYKGGQLLHAKELTLIHPTLHRKMTFNAPLPIYFEDVLKTL
ncbi:MAG: RluA family pseudouridine synthase [Methanomicrobia archaeon]|nr:RluA family pseudouridine synthase [Methanomicrobia archaeon]